MYLDVTCRLLLLNTSNKKVSQIYLFQFVYTHSSQVLKWSHETVLGYCMRFQTCFLFAPCLANLSDSFWFNQRDVLFKFSVQRKLQALVNDILPSTTAVFSYAIGSRKLSANEQGFFFFFSSNSSKFVTNNSDCIRRLFYNWPCCLRQHK